MTQRELPPGPAFISAASIDPAWHDGTRPDIEWPGDDEDWWRMEYNVPLGYIFRPATDCTPAGWVRPMGKAMKIKHKTRLFEAVTARDGMLRQWCGRVFGRFQGYGVYRLRPTMRRLTMCVHEAPVAETRQKTSSCVALAAIKPAADKADRPAPLQRPN